MSKYDCDHKTPDSKRTISWENELHMVIVPLLEFEGWRGKTVLALGVGKSLAEREIINALATNKKTGLTINPDNITFVDKKLDQTGEIEKIYYEEADLFQFVENAANSEKKYDLILMLGIEYVFYRREKEQPAFIINLKKILSKNGVIVAVPIDESFKRKLLLSGFEELVTHIYKKQ